MRIEGHYDIVMQGGDLANTQYPLASLALSISRNVTRSDLKDYISQQFHCHCCCIRNTHCYDFLSRLNPNLQPIFLALQLLDNVDDPHRGTLMDGSRVLAGSSSHKERRER